MLFQSADAFITDHDDASVLLADLLSQFTSDGKLLNGLLVPLQMLQLDGQIIMG